ncbi:hypothetical protein U9M48_012386 [Paspalum notatum var. saurae]|uniref:Protein kinase domain-containing protein n=1 Tax=Paspalum notatum var. saurae TaxID=547442 RepID=A0AAQ3SXH6_PASNO
METASSIVKVIRAIMQAAQTASRNKKTCRELGESAQRIGDLLRVLQQQPGITMLQHPETSAALAQLRETLETARELVESCGRGGYLRGLCAGESRAARLQDVQSRISFFLQVFPIISHLDSTRLLVRVIGKAATSASSSPGFENLSLTELMNATNGFSVDNQIEQGPLATLYKGQLHGKDVILKRHSVSSSGQQLPPCMSRYELFKNEMSIIPKLQHNNIVKLKGFCAERSERILVYEYMENRSLEDLIFGMLI